MTDDELQAIIAGVDQAVSQRLESVYQGIEAVRAELYDQMGQVRSTFETLDGTDLAIIAKMQEIMEHLLRESGAGEGGEGGDETVDTVSGFMGAAGGAWERFVKAEAEKLGLIGRTKGKVTT